MITVQSNSLQISIHTGSPLELRDLLILDLAAALRWAARDPDKYEADNESQYRIAQLIEELVKTGYQPHPNPLQKEREKKDIST